MALIGRLHPLLVHFPIALIVLAAGAEVLALATARQRWRTFAIANAQAGAAFALVAVVAGWRLALEPGMDSAPLLEWHRWLGVSATAAVLAAALATVLARRHSTAAVWIYRVALFIAGVLVAVTGHLGGVLVWGAEFLRP
jgi:uncharacterized membrane protein